jgi:hypothetical protein
MLVPRWLRIAMFLTALMNLGGALAFLPAAGAAVRRLAGMPVEAPPIYLLTVGAFIFIFGVGYLWTAVTGLTDRLFVAVGAAGKLTFVALVGWCVADGSLPPIAFAFASPDLAFGALFLLWLFGSRAAPYPHFAATTARG